jgi:hypothetical protein
MENDRSELRWGVEQRLEFIEFRLFWEGHVNRSDLMDQFGVSVNQASTDLNRYIGFAPDNMVYDKSARTYVRGSDFKAQFLEPDASRYLAQLRSLADGILDREDSWIANLPPYASAPTPVRGVNPVTLRSVVGAIRRSEAIEVKYQSLSSPEPRWRWIAPHAIAFDGFRWHTRAFCLTDECFKDFLLVPDAQDPRITGERRVGRRRQRLAFRGHAGGRPPPRPVGDAGEGHRARLRHARRQGEDQGPARAPLLRAEAAWPRYRSGSKDTAGPADRAPVGRRWRRKPRPVPMFR